METFDVIVVGGGPAGMMAAGHAAEYGRNVLLLEKNPTLGKKLELSGGGRCNITNAEFDNRQFLANYSENAKFLFSPFSRFAAQDTFDFFAERGLPFIVEDRKRAFPETEKAADVTRVMKNFMDEYGVDIRFGLNVKQLLLEDGAVVGVETNCGPFRAESVVLATGGTSYAATGSTGEAFQWLEKGLPPGVAVFGLRGVQSQAPFLAGYGAWLRTSKPFVWVIGDNDEAGRALDHVDTSGNILAEPSFLERIRAMGCPVHACTVNYEGCKDFNDLWRDAPPSVDTMQRWAAHIGAPLEVD